MNQQTPTLEQIKEKLVDELNISHLTEQEQGEVITQMSTLLLDRITMAIVGELPQTEMARVDKLLEANQTDAVQAIITKHVPNAADIAEIVIAETMGEYSAILAKMGQN